jgi:hypothetical protein
LAVLLFEIVFPALGFGENDNRMWEEDPEEFLRLEYG